MKFTSNTKTILEHINGVISSACEKNTLPVLSHVLLEVSNGILNFYTTNLESFSVSTMSLSGEYEDGCNTIPIFTLHDFLKTWKTNENISFDTNKENEIFVKVNKTTLNLLGYPKHEFPEKLGDNFNFSCKVPIASFSALLNQSLTSAEPTTKCSIYGILLVSKDNSISVISSDGTVLTKTQRLITINEELPEKAVISVKNAYHIISFLSKEDEEFLEIGYKNSVIGIKCGKNITYIRLLDTTYHAYEQLFNEFLDVKRKMTINYDVFFATIKRSIALSADGNPCTTLNVLDNLFSITTITDSGEEYTEKDECISSTPFTVILRSKQLMKIMNACDKDNIDIYLSEDNKKVLLKNTDKDYFNSIISVISR